MVSAECGFVNGTDVRLPVVAQGAIGIERGVKDDRIAEMLDAIRHPETESRISAERAF